MAIAHARPGEAIDVQPLGNRLPGEKTVALFKSRDLELIRLVLPAGRSLPPHKVQGELTIQCVEGRINVIVDGESHLLTAGHLLYLSGDALHEVAAIERASALVTVALRK